MSERGFVKDCSDFNGLDHKLMEGVQSAYIGFDATADSLHIGNLLGIMMLAWFQKTGHKPVTLMGGGTTKIGDPSGKDETRKLLSNKDINDNITSIQKVFSKFINYDGSASGAIMSNNDAWLSTLHYIDFLRDVGRHFSVNRMLAMDSVRNRLERDQEMSFIEFNYMICQGYDFVQLHERHGTVLQMGGSDQWGNIIQGVELGRRMKNYKLFALTTPLLENAAGEKMGKTAGGATVWLNADKMTPYDYWQFWRNVEDVKVSELLRKFTFLAMSEVKKLEALGGSEINEAKKILATEATALCHGRDAANAAADTAKTTFEQGAAGGDLPTVSVSKVELEAGIALIDVLIKVGFATSKSEARRLIQGNGAYVNDNPVVDVDYKCTGKDIGAGGAIKISSGKKKHALIKSA
jgi:tyrosyl-tRNA synthetase